MEATAEVSKTFNEKIRKYCDMTLLSCAYAGTGNVLKAGFFFLLFIYNYLALLPKIKTNVTVDAFFM